MTKPKGRHAKTDSSDDEAVPRHDRDHARRRDEERGRQVGHGLRHDGCQQVRAAPRHDDDQGLGEEEEPRSGEPLEPGRSEEHTSELQSRINLVCRLLLEKKKKKY